MELLYYTVSEAAKLLRTTPNTIRVKIREGKIPTHPLEGYPLIPKEFIDNSDTFSLTFFDDSFKKALGYLGATSGRDEDKIAKSNLTVRHTDGVPYFAEAKIAILCNKLYAQEYKPELFVAQEINEKCYPDADHHTLYIAEITKILVKE